YGGSVENRARFALEVTDAVVAAIGAERTGIRFSPFGIFQGTNTSDIIKHYSYVISEIDKRGLAYVHMIEPRADLIISEEAKVKHIKDQVKARGLSEDKIADFLSLKVFKQVLKNTPLISNGNFDDKNVFAPINNGEIDAVAYGRFFISNPDLPERLRKGLPLAKYDRSTFYTQGPEGYIDYPTYEEQK
ncbi:NADPH dehydrogenase, partial [Rhizina undulata]